MITFARRSPIFHRWRVRLMKQFHRLATRLGFALFLFSTCAAAGPQQMPLPKGAERVTSVEGVTEYRLSNGLRVLLFLICRNKPLRSTLPIWSAHFTRTMAKREWPIFWSISSSRAARSIPTYPRNSWSMVRVRRNNLAGSNQLLRDVSSQRRQPGLGARSRSGPNGELLCRSEGSGQ